MLTVIQRYLDTSITSPSQELFISTSDKFYENTINFKRSVVIHTLRDNKCSGLGHSYTYGTMLTEMRKLWNVAMGWHSTAMPKGETVLTNSQEFRAK